tara:strand:+ start:1867 stop:2205 length:339 start_codon:yes stop_codon:yes gene_type:complete
MTFFTVRRMLGPISTQMGGDSDPTGSGGGGGGSVTINNNVDGYMLKATGLANTVEGVPQLQWDSSTTTLSASANIYVSGSSNYYYLHGVDADGNNVKFKVAVQGSILQIAPP